MEKWQICNTPKGIRLIDGKGYTYIKDNQTDNTSFWRCDFRPWKCKARASIEKLYNPQNKSSEFQEKITFNLISHRHPPSINDTKLSTQSKNDSISSTDYGEMCLKWNTHYKNMCSVLSDLQQQERYVDVTLVVEHKYIYCHKIILSSCSKYFDEMLQITGATNHPIIFLHNMEYWKVKLLVDFMYQGEISIDQGKLDELLKAAAELQVKGLGNTFNKNTKTASHISARQQSSTKATSLQKKSSKIPMIIDLVAEESAFLEETENNFVDEINNSTCKKSRKRRMSSTSNKELKNTKINVKHNTKSCQNIKKPKYLNSDMELNQNKQSTTTAKMKPDSVKISITRIASEDKVTKQLELPRKEAVIDIETIASCSSEGLVTNNQLSKSDSQINKNSDLNPFKELQMNNNIKNSSNSKHNKPKSLSKERILALDDDAPLSLTESINDVANLVESPIPVKPFLELKLPESPKPNESKTLKNMTHSETEAGKNATFNNKKFSEVLNINKKGIILKSDALKNIFNITTIKDSNNLPKILVKNLPTTNTMLKKIAVSKHIPVSNQSLIVKQVNDGENTIPTSAIIVEKNITGKISTLAKTKRELTRPKNISIETSNKDDESSSSSSNCL